MRPISISLFEILYTISLLMTFLQLYFGNPDIIKEDNIFDHFIEEIITFVFMFIATISISRFKFKPAIWILLLINLIGQPFALISLLNDVIVGSKVIFIAQMCTQIICMVLLFIPASRRWLNEKHNSKKLNDVFS